MVRIGRPPKQESERKSLTIGIRMTPALRDGLKTAADDSGRTISEEIEARLRLSLDASEQMEKAFGQGTTFWFLRLISIGIRSIEAAECKRWWEDRFTFEAVSAFMSTAVDRLRPKGRNLRKEQIAEARANGEELAVTIMFTLKGVFAGERPRPAADLLRSLGLPSSPETEAQLDADAKWIESAWAFAMAGPLAPKTHYFTKSEAIDHAHRLGLIGPEGTATAPARKSPKKREPQR